MSSLRPPLPPPLSHEGISFVSGSAAAGDVSPEVASLIANALSAALPAGDFVVASNGAFHFNAMETLTSWQLASRLEAITRVNR